MYENDERVNVPDTWANPSTKPIARAVHSLIYVNGLFSVTIKVYTSNVVHTCLLMMNKMHYGKYS